MSFVLVSRTCKYFAIHWHCLSVGNLLIRLIWLGWLGWCRWLEAGQLLGAVSMSKGWATTNQVANLPHCPIRNEVISARFVCCSFAISIVQVESDRIVRHKVGFFWYILLHFIFIPRTQIEYSSLYYQLELNVWCLNFFSNYLLRTCISKLIIFRLKG